MFDAGAPPHGPLDYSNSRVTPAAHTHTHPDDLRLAHEAWVGGGAAELVTKVLKDLHSHRRGGGGNLLKRQARVLPDSTASRCHTLRNSEDSSASRENTHIYVHSIKSVKNEDFQPFSLRLVSGECA